MLCFQTECRTEVVFYTVSECRRTMHKVSGIKLQSRFDLFTNALDTGVVLSGFYYYHIELDRMQAPQIYFTIKRALTEAFTKEL